MTKFFLYIAALVLVVIIPYKIMDFGGKFYDYAFFDTFETEREEERQQIKQKDDDKTREELLLYIEGL